MGTASDSAPAPERPARPRLGVDERRAQLIALGLELFGERTYEEISIDEIARAAGISKGLLYHYFPSKRDFYVATIRAAAEQLVEQVHVEAERESEPLEGLRRALDAYLDFVDSRAKAFSMLMRGGVGSDPEVSAILDGARGRIVERLLEGVAAEHPLTPPLRTMLRGWIGLVEASVLEWVDTRDVDRVRLREMLVAMLEATVATASS